MTVRTPATPTAARRARSTAQAPATPIRPPRGAGGDRHGSEPALGARRSPQSAARRGSRRPRSGNHIDAPQGVRATGRQDVRCLGTRRVRDPAPNAECAAHAGVDRPPREAGILLAGGNVPGDRGESDDPKRHRGNRNAPDAIAQPAEERDQRERPPRAALGCPTLAALALHRKQQTAAARDEQADIANDSSRTVEAIAKESVRCL
jgi:hypothetical protein